MVLSDLHEALSTASSHSERVALGYEIGLSVRVLEAMIVDSMPLHMPRIKTLLLSLYHMVMSTGIQYWFYDWEDGSDIL
jgi:hypothetical protein